MPTQPRPSSSASVSGDRPTRLEGRSLSRRIQILDPLRGVAAAAVMWFHFTNGPLLTGEGASAWLRATGSKGWLGVEMFFVISGFVLPYAMWRGRYRLADCGTFFAKRLLRLEPPYLCAVLLTLGLWGLSSLAPGFSGDAFSLNPLQLLLHAGYLITYSDFSWYNPVFWTLAIEFQFYILVGILFPLLVHARTAVRVAVLLVLAACGSIDLPGAHLLQYLPVFGLGIVAAQYVTGHLERGGYLSLSAVMALASLAGLGPYRAVICGATAALIVFSATRTTAPVVTARPLVRLGALSYSLYLLHVPIGGRVVNLGARFADSLLEQIAVLALAVAASLLAAYALHRWVEGPSQRWSSALRYDRETNLHGVGRPTWSRKRAA